MGKRILWIEDEAYQLEGMIRPLRKSGYEITTALDAKDALNKMEKIEFDLLLLDVLIPIGSRCEKSIMPDCSAEIGLGFLEKLKKDNFKIPPIILFSVIDYSQVEKELKEKFNVVKVIVKRNYLPTNLKDDVDLIFNI